MKSRIARDYVDAAARVSEMDDAELARWYAKAARDYTTLSLWARFDRQGETTETAWRMRREWCEAAADLFVAIENRIAAPETRITGIGLLGEAYRRDIS